MKVFYKKEIRNGKVLSLEATSEPPYVCITRMMMNQWYTLFMFDPDAKGGNKIHWLLTNIHHSHRGLTVFRYIPPHPPEKTGYHRYVFWIFQHPRPVHVPRYLKTGDRYVDVSSVMKSLNLSFTQLVDSFLFRAQYEKR